MAKAKKAAAPKAAKAVKPKKTSAKFVSLTVKATIPTQAFGNIQPEITVQASSFEEARDFAMPHIENLYKHYAESKPAFLGKVTEEVKVVAPAPTPKAEEPAVPSSVAPSAPSSSTSTPTPETPAAQKPEPVLKAEKAISLATTEDAMLVIQGQIEKSTKIPQEFKADLLTMCLKRRGEINK